VRQKTAEQLFGIALKAARQRAKISQEELGFRANVHRTYVSQLERGLKSPSLDVILRVAKPLGVPAWNLVRAVEEKLHQ
jgi:transcriptional regulator with XRE-family HTH domain